MKATESCVVWAQNPREPWSSMFNWLGHDQYHNYQPLMDYLSRGCGAPETQIWADLRAIYIFEVLEVAGLGIWLVKVLSINPFLSLLPPLEESRTLVQ